MMWISESPGEVELTVQQIFFFWPIFHSYFCFYFYLFLCMYMFV